MKKSEKPARMLKYRKKSDLITRILTSNPNRNVSICGTRHCKFVIVTIGKLRMK